ncbi:MAG: uL15 family ribosomal protein, partial [Gemmatimonadota bacterium]
ARDQVGPADADGVPREIVRTLRQPVKVLGQGELGKALTVEAHAFSKSAREKIEAAGGSVSVLGSDDAGQA